jgi:sulfate permease, SulP family
VLLNVSIYLPAPLLALGVGTLLSFTMLAGDNLTLIKSKYGPIPTNFLQITPPVLPSWDWPVLGDLVFYSLAFAFVCGFESILSARLADRLADNRRTPYDPNKEFWGQGLVQLAVPLLNGMPLSGALARSATNIKLGAMTPLAGIMKCVLKLLLAFFLARYLEMVPMACLAGILLWVSANMIKPAEIKQVWAQGWFHFSLMTYTAIMVIVSGFLTGVVSAMVIYGVLYRFMERPVVEQAEPQKMRAAA